MFTIKYKAPSGRWFEHTANWENMAHLLTHELKGVTYKSVGPNKFDLSKDPRKQKAA
jgi:hypothetical protein